MRLILMTSSVHRRLQRRVRILVAAAMCLSLVACWGESCLGEDSIEGAPVGGNSVSQRFAQLELTICDHCGTWEFLEAPVIEIRSITGAGSQEGGGSLWEAVHFAAIPPKENSSAERSMSSVSFIGSVPVRAGEAPPVLELTFELEQCVRGKTERLAGYFSAGRYTRPLHLVNAQTTGHQKPLLYRSAASTSVCDVTTTWLFDQPPSEEYLPDVEMSGLLYMATEMRNLIIEHANEGTSSVGQEARPRSDEAVVLSELTKLLPGLQIAPGPFEQSFLAGGRESVLRQHLLSTVHGIPTDPDVVGPAIFGLWSHVLGTYPSCDGVSIRRAEGAGAIGGSP